MFELIIFGGFLGLNMIVSMARESSADFFALLEITRAVSYLEFHYLHSSVLIFLTDFNLSPFFNGSALKKLMPSAPASIDILAIL